MVYEWVLKSIINDKLSNGKDLALQKQITRRLLGTQFGMIYVEHATCPISNLCSSAATKR